MGTGCFFILLLISDKRENFYSLGKVANPPFFPIEGSVAISLEKGTGNFLNFY
jgi:hypothetical protein